jgi:two-component system, NarL family, sensor kinase
MDRSRSHPAALWLLIIAALAGSLAFVGWRLFAPSDGALIPFYGDAWTEEGVRITQLEDGASRLRGDDVVMAIEGQSVSAWVEQALLPIAGSPGLSEEIAYRVERDGAVLDVSVTLVQRDTTPLLLDNWGSLLFAVVVLGLGLYVLWRRPELPAARALAVTATAAGGSALPWLLSVHVSDIYQGGPYLLYFWLVNPLYMLLWPAATLHLPLALMPGRQAGRFLTGRGLALVYAIPMGMYVLLLAATRLGTPTTSAWIGTWPPVQGLIIVPCVLVGVGLTVVAYRRATPNAQRQLRWALVGALMAGIVSTALMFAPLLLLGRPLISWNAIGLIALPLPVGLAVAILRHGLFDIETVVNRTLVYGGVTLAVLTIYAMAVLVIGAVVPQGAGFAASLLATGLAAIVALPVRDFLQRSVNRLMYGDRDDPYRALARLSRRLESTIEPLAIPAAIVESVAEALRAPYVKLEIGPPDRVEMASSHGQPTGEPLSLPLVYGAESVGRLLIARRAPNENYSASDMRLLDGLARGAGAAVHSVRLTLDVIRSRERLVAAREEERRRIRRDLHDGLGPTLAAIGMRAEVASEMANRDPAAAAEVLNDLTAEVGGALIEVRRLVEGLRPPALDEVGLIGAISLQAERLGSSTTFDVAADGVLPDLPAAVEVAAYRIAVEAMTNAARHASAHQCRVRIGFEGQGGAGLRLEISDDGRGLPGSVRPGIGLGSMRERAAEVGGTFHLGPGENGGTRVVARLPINPQPAASP